MCTWDENQIFLFHEAYMIIMHYRHYFDCIFNASFPKNGILLRCGDITKNYNSFLPQNPHLRDSNLED